MGASEDLGLRVELGCPEFGAQFSWGGGHSKNEDERRLGSILQRNYNIFFYKKCFYLYELHDIWGVLHDARFTHPAPTLLTQRV